MRGEGMRAKVAHGHRHAGRPAEEILTSRGVICSFSGWHLGSLVARKRVLAEANGRVNEKPIAAGVEFFYQCT